MSNVKTGDLAILISGDCAGAICTVGASTNYARFITATTTTGERQLICTFGTLGWFCDFPEDRPFGDVNGYYVNPVPIPDSALRRITGPDVDVDNLTVDWDKAEELLKKKEKELV